LRTKLSLNAEKNWHQNNGANRRDVIKVRNMMAGAPWNGSGWTPEIGGAVKRLPRCRLRLSSARVDRPQPLRAKQRRLQPWLY
jgi:hypothetical protein